MDHPSPASAAVRGPAQLLPALGFVLTGLLGRALIDKALALRGAYTWAARTVTPSETLPGHASMLSGEEPKVHIHKEHGYLGGSMVTMDDTIQEIIAASEASAEEAANA